MVNTRIKRSSSKVRVKKSLTPSSRSTRASRKAIVAERKSYEFGGPVGACVTMCSLPMVAFWLLDSVQNKRTLKEALSDVYQDPYGFLKRLYEPELKYYAFGIYIGWFILQLAGHCLLPGRTVKGAATVDEKGTRLRYVLNGLLCYLMTLVLFGCAVVDKLHGTFGNIFVDPSSIVGGDMHIKLFRAANTVAWVIAMLIYAMCHVKWFANQADRCTGCVPYDYFMGATTNPRIGWFDLKFFCESRPGLILWVLFNFSLALKQFESGRITSPMLLVCFFQFFYILDYFWQEDSILSTMDIMHDPFGWMLCWGDIVYVPFSYSLQAFYLYHNSNVDINYLWAGCIFVLHFVGYKIFRESNNQKHDFRSGITDKIWGEKVAFVQTSRGTKLLASGWWGKSRHPNYLGDIMMAVAYSLPCGFGSVFPYFYPIYFWILLVHRERRDNSHCAKKYGKDWEVYCAKVPYRIIPFVY